MTIIVSVEGNIGSGKTTLIQDLKNVTFNKPHVIVLEKVSEWMEMKNSQGENILELFYKDQDKYSYIFQSHVLFSRLTHLLKACKENPNGIVICERCHLTDLMVFAKTLFELEKLNEIEWKVYQDWHDLICNMFPIHISAIIYNRASAETCMNRIIKRSRSGESTIGLDYLTRIHNKHEDWLWTDQGEKAPVMIIDGEIDMTESDKRKEIIDRVVEFVDSLSLH